MEMGEVLRDEDYSAKGIRTVEALGLAGLNPEGLKNYLETGELAVTQ